MTLIDVRAGESEEQATKRQQAEEQAPKPKPPPKADPPQGRILPGLSREDYDRVQAVNWSSLKLLGKSPLHYRHNLLEQRADTDAMRMGRAVHLAVLEPERFGAECVLWSGGRRAGKEWEAFQAHHAGRNILKPDEFDECLAIQKAARADATAAKYLEGGKGEVSMMWTRTVEAVGGLPGYSVPCKGRVDFLSDLGCIVDMKTTRDASPGAFARQCWNLGYHAQAAFYADGHRTITGKPTPFVVVAVESAAPYAVQVYRVPEDVLEAGREHYRTLLDRLQMCRTESRWPGYADGELDLALPQWVTKTNDDEDLAGMDLAFNAEG